MNKWKLFRDYINSYNSNEIITRKNINKFVCGGHTIDSYINLSRNCGFIKNVDFGKYSLNCKIPNNFTSSKIKEMAYLSESSKIKMIRKIKLLSINDTVR